MWATLAVQGILCLLRTFYPSSPYPAPLLLYPCSLGVLPRWPEVSPAARVSVSSSGLTGSAQSLCRHPRPGQKAKQPGLADKDNAMSAEPEHPSLPCSGEGGEGRSLMQTVCVFPKPAFLTNSCVYTKLGKKERERRERTVSFPGMTSFCVVCFGWLPPLEKGGLLRAGERAWYKVSACSLAVHAHN